MHPPQRRLSGKLAHPALLLLGIVVGQVILYGPSLIGRKVLLPLDILAQPSMYIPVDPARPPVEVRNPHLMDLVCVMEPARRFAASELRQGRLPVWAPYQFAGAPFIWPKFSPFLAFQSCVQSPVIIAWGQLLAALVAGIGAYVLFRYVLLVGFWPAAIGAWCYPLTAFFIFWQGFTTALAVCWLPWLLWAVDATVHGRGRFPPIALALLTALTLVSGQLDTAGQVLLCAGLFGLCRLAGLALKREYRRLALARALKLGLAWALGFVIAAPHVLPVLEYTRTGARMVSRAAGHEERPPTGLSALPEVVLPFIYGSSERGSLRYAKIVELEGAAAAYAGSFGLVLLGPLAWCSRRHKNLNLFWMLMALVGLSWCLNVPGLVQILRLPGLNMFSHNRFVFVTALSLLAVTITGLDTVSREALSWRKWFWIPVGLLSGLTAWCVFRGFVLPWEIETALGSQILKGRTVAWIHDLEGVGEVQAWFTERYLLYALICGLALLGWYCIHARKHLQSWFVPAVGAIMVGELLCFGYGRNPQCDPSLYYPANPVLESVAKAGPGRVLGIYCLPANVASMAGLRDIRGYDAIDPARLIDLLALTVPASYQHPEYAYSQPLIPRFTLEPDGGIRFPPVLDLLQVRFGIFRGSPPANVIPVFQGSDYWVLTNKFVLPRAFVPRRVEQVASAGARLERMGAAMFDPRNVAYVESSVALPESCRGSADVINETPTRISLSVRAETPALVVLSDLWDSGWRAFLNGREVQVLRVDHALRGVLVAAGEGKLEFRYEPASLCWGLRLSAAALIAVLGWAWWLSRAERRNNSGGRVNANG